MDDSFLIKLPEFDNVICPTTGDIELSRDGFCNACGKTGHAKA